LTGQTSTQIHPTKVSAPAAATAKINQFETTTAKEGTTPTAVTNAAVINTAATNTAATKDAATKDAKTKDSTTKDFATKDATTKDAATKPATTDAATSIEPATSEDTRPKDTIAKETALTQTPVTLVKYRTTSGDVPPKAGPKFVGKVNCNLVINGKTVAKLVNSGDAQQRVPGPRESQVVPVSGPLVSDEFLAAEAWEEEVVSQRRVHWLNCLRAKDEENEALRARIRELDERIQKTTIPRQDGEVLEKKIASKNAEIEEWKERFAAQERDFSAREADLTRKLEEQIAEGETFRNVLDIMKNSLSQQ
jgi:hypothetical protein